jgi:hypothetical protein
MSAISCQIGASDLVLEAPPLSQGSPGAVKAKNELGLLLTMVARPVMLLLKRKRTRSAMRM